MTAAELRRKAAEAERQAMTLTDTAAEADRDLTAEELAVFTELVGDPNEVQLGKIGGQAARYRKQADIREKLETGLAASGAKLNRATELPTAPAAKPGESTLFSRSALEDSLRDRYAAARKAEMASMSD
jgi:hypothetical protein